MEKKHTINSAKSGILAKYSIYSQGVDYTKFLLEGEESQEQMSDFGHSLELPPSTHSSDLLP